MRRLALRVDARFLATQRRRAILPLAAGAAVQLDRHGAGSVLLYLQEHGGPVRYIGVAQAGMSQSDPARPDDFYAELSDIAFFEHPLPGSEDIALTSWHAVTPEQMPEPPALLELAEAAERFEPFPQAETGSVPVRAVLENCGFTCAWSGRVFAPAPAPHPDLSVAALTPQTGPEAAQVSAYLALQHEAAAAFRELHFTAADNHAVIADLSRLSKTLLAERHASGRLVLPAYPAVPPDPLRMAEHRLAFFRRQRG